MEKYILFRIRSLNIKMSVLLKVISRFNAISIKIPADFLKMKIDKLFLNLQRNKRPWYSKNNFEKEQIWMIHIYQISKLTRGQLQLTKTAWYWHMDKFRDRQNRIESSEIGQKWSIGYWKGFQVHSMWKGESF